MAADAAACSAITLGAASYDATTDIETASADCGAVQTAASFCFETAIGRDSDSDDAYNCENVPMGTATSGADCDAVLTANPLDVPTTQACTYSQISACTYTPKPRTGCVIRGCEEGYWNATGADAELFECYVPVDEFVTTVCTKSVGHCWESDLGLRPAQGPLFTTMNGLLKPVVCDSLAGEVGDPCLGDDTKVSTCSEPGRCVAKTDGGYVMYPSGVVYRDGTLAKEVGRPDGRVSECGEHSASCVSHNPSGTGRDGVTSCDLRGLTDGRYDCAEGCIYSEKPCNALFGGTTVWATFIHPDFGEYCAPHSEDGVDDTGMQIRNQIECEATPGNVWELMPRWVTDPCVWGDATTAGTDTVFLDCSHPVAENLEWVQMPCRSGSIWVVGADTVTQTCAEPTLGINYVGALCVTGAYNEYGRDTLLLPCKDTADLTDGTFITEACIPGSSTVLGRDTQVSTCSLPNGNLPDRLDNGEQLHSTANTVDHSCEMLVMSTCVGSAFEILPSCSGTSRYADTGKICDLDPLTDETVVAATCTGTASGADLGKICDLDLSTDSTDTCPIGCVFEAAYGLADGEACPIGCKKTGIPECATSVPGGDDGTGTQATCTGTATDVDVGKACDLDLSTDGIDSCPIGCVSQLATAGASCALTADKSACVVAGGDCVYIKLAAYTPTCDLNPATDATGACPAGCAGSSGSDLCWKSFGTGAERYCAPTASTDAAHGSSCTSETCASKYAGRSSAVEVAATCTGMATPVDIVTDTTACTLTSVDDDFGTATCTGTATRADVGKTCNLTPTDSTSACPIGCVQTASAGSCAEVDGSAADGSYCAYVGGAYTIPLETCTSTLTAGTCVDTAGLIAGVDFDACAAVSALDTNTACVAVLMDCVSATSGSCPAGCTDSCPAGVCACSGTSTDLACSYAQGTTDDDTTNCALTGSADYGATPGTCASAGTAPVVCDPADGDVSTNIGCGALGMVSALGCGGGAVCVPAGASYAPSDTHTCAITVGTTIQATVTTADSCTSSTTMSCDLAPTDGTSECLPGCVDTAAYVPVCDLDLATDKTDLCPAGCQTGTLPDGVPTEAWRGTTLSYDELGTTYLAPYAAVHLSTVGVQLGQTYGRAHVVYPWIDDEVVDNSCEHREVAALNSALEAGALDCASLLPMGRWFSCCTGTATGVDAGKTCDLAPTDGTSACPIGCVVSCLPRPNVPSGACQGNDLPQIRTRLNLAYASWLQLPAAAATCTGIETVADTALCTLSESADFGATSGSCADQGITATCAPVAGSYTNTLDSCTSTLVASPNAVTTIDTNLCSLTATVDFGANAGSCTAANAGVATCAYVSGSWAISTPTTCTSTTTATGADLGMICDLTPTDGTKRCPVGCVETAGNMRPYSPPAAPLDCAHLSPPGRWYGCKDATGALTCVPRPKVLGGQFTESSCEPGSSVAVGADTVIAECSLPKFYDGEFEFVSAVCTSGDHSGSASCTGTATGADAGKICDLTPSDGTSACPIGCAETVGASDTQFDSCTPPVDGQWSQSGCDHGSWDTTGTDTIIATCSFLDPTAAATCTGTATGADLGKICDLDLSTDSMDSCPIGCVETGEVADGDYVQYNCEKGSISNGGGRDTQTAACGMPTCHYFVAGACVKGVALAHGFDSLIVGCTQPPLHQYMIESLPWLPNAATDDLVWNDAADYVTTAVTEVAEACNVATGACPFTAGNALSCLTTGGFPNGCLYTPDKANTFYDEEACDAPACTFAAGAASSCTDTMGCVYVAPVTGVARGHGHYCANLQPMGRWTWCPTTESCVPDPAGVPTQTWRGQGGGVRFPLKNLH